MSCGTPTPATMRVVQIEPGPMPILTASAPASISACAPSRGGDVAGHHLGVVAELLHARHGIEHALRMAVRGVDHDDVDLGIDQQLGAAQPVLADAGRRGGAQAALLVLAGAGELVGLLDVLDGDQADAAIVVVDHQQLLDAALVQEPLGLVRAHAFAHRDQLLLGHQRAHRRGVVGGEADVAVGQDADELAAARSTTGMPEIWCAPSAPARRPGSARDGW